MQKKILSTDKTCLTDKTNLSVKRMSLNRSQCGSCSTEYDTLTCTQVVYKRFGTGTPRIGWVGKSSAFRAQDSDLTPGRRPKPSVPRTVLRSNSKVAMSRRVSALEAFRRIPTDGSFAPSFDRMSTCTKCPNLRFLSY